MMESYTGCMDNGIHALNRILQVHNSLREISCNDEIELADVLRTRFYHHIGLLSRSSRSSHTNTTIEQLVDDVGADETSCTGHEDVAGWSNLDHEHSSRGECGVDDLTMD